MSTQRTRQALEDALTDNPDDRAAHAAYADFLAEQDDPALQARGEFISVQLALEDEARPLAERKQLQAREQQLLQAHQRPWLGTLAPLLDEEPPWVPEDAEPIPLFQFRRGWLDQLNLNYLPLSVAEALRQRGDAWLLQGLTISSAQWQWDGQERRSALGELTPSNALGAVRRLRLGPDQGDEYEQFEGSENFTPEVLDLLRKMPNLEELALLGNGLNLNRLFTLSTLSHLRILQVYHAAQVHRLPLLAEGSTFRNLTHLLIHPHHVAHYDSSDGADEADGYDVYQTGYLPLAVARPFLRATNLPNLRHLRLRLSSMGDEGCEEIVASGILSRLETLDLRHGCITDRGAQTLTACPELRRLRWLDLDRNALTSKGVEAIKALGIPVRIESQLTRAEVNEMRYLCEGEFE